MIAAPDGAATGRALLAGLPTDTVESLRNASPRKVHRTLKSLGVAKLGHRLSAQMALKQMDGADDDLVLEENEAAPRSSAELIRALGEKRSVGEIDDETDVVLEDNASPAVMRYLAADSGCKSPAPRLIRALAASEEAENSAPPNLSGAAKAAAGLALLASAPRSKPALIAVPPVAPAVAMTSGGLLSASLVNRNQRDVDEEAWDPTEGCEGEYEDDGWDYGGGGHGGDEEDYGDEDYTY